MIVFCLKTHSAKANQLDSILYWHTYHSLRLDFSSVENLLETSDPETNWAKLLTADYLISQGKNKQADSIQNSIEVVNLNKEAKAQYFYNQSAKYIWSYEPDELQLALQLLDSSLHIISQNTPDILSYKIRLNKAITLINIGSPDYLNDASSILDQLQSLTSTPEFIKVISWYQTGRIAFSQGDQQKFLQANLNCSRINKDIGFWETDHPVTIFIKNSIGMSFKEVGDYRTAIIYLEEVVDYYKERDIEKYLERLLNLASIYQEAEDNQKAKSLYEEILEQRTTERDTLFYQVLNNYSEVLFELGQTGKSIRIAREVLKGKKKLFDTNNRSLHISYLNIADLYFRAEDYSKAIHFYETFFKETSNDIQDDGGLVTKALLGLAYCYTRKGDITQATFYFQKAMSASIIGEYHFQNLHPDLLVSITGHLESSIGLLKMDLENLAIDTFLGRVDYINQTILHAFENYESREAKIGVYKLSKTYFDLIIQKYYTIFEQTKSERILEELINQIEFSKSAFFRSKVNRDKLFSMMDQGSSYRDSLKDIESQILANQRTILKGENNKESDNIRKSLIQLIENKMELTDQLHSEIPEMQFLSNEKIDLNRIQEHILDQGIDILVSYYYSDTYLIYIAITPMKVFTVYKHVDIESKLNPYLNSFFRQPLNQNVQDFQNQSHELFNLLFDLEINENSNVLIIPYNRMAYLPIHSLVFEADPDLKNFRYLNYSSEIVGLSQHFSIQAFLSESGNDHNKDLYYGMAPDFSGTPYLELPLAREEIIDASTVLDGTASLGASASREALLSEGIQSEVLHLATHAFIDSIEPILNSYILLQDSENHSIVRVYASDFYGMDIQSKLTILSACDTGNGIVEEGEGVSSLARAFFYAGCPSLFMSLWPANDFVAKEITTMMIENLNSGKKLNKAYQTAVNGFVQNTINDQLTHPYYWSNFLLIGDSTYSVERSSNSHWPFTTVIILFLGFILLIVFRRKTVNKNF